MANQFMGCRTLRLRVGGGLKRLRMKPGPVVQDAFARGRRHTGKTGGEDRTVKGFQFCPEVIGDPFGAESQSGHGQQRGNGIGGETRLHGSIGHGGRGAVRTAAGRRAHRINIVGMQGMAGQARRKSAADDPDLLGKQAVGLGLGGIELSLQFFPEHVCLCDIGKQFFAFADRGGVRQVAPAGALPQYLQRGRCPCHHIGVVEHEAHGIRRDVLRLL